MKLDYDLSDLETSQADLWLFLRVDAVCAQILADQAKRRASTRSKQPQTWPRRHQRHSRGRLRMRSYSLPERIDLGALNGLLSQSVSPWASPAPWSSVTPCIRAAFPWVH